jgi:hypothetical protein
MKWKKKKKKLIVVTTDVLRLSSKIEKNIGVDDLS